MKVPYGAIQRLGRNLGLVCVFIVVLAVQLRAEVEQPTLVVNGSPLPTARPANRIGNEWSIPIVPVARQLGIELTYVASTQTIQTRRGNGIEVVYDSRSGDIRSGHISIGQVRDRQQGPILGLSEDLVLPASVIVALLGVTIEEDNGHNILRIDSTSKDLEGKPDLGGVFDFADLNYTVGMTTNGKQASQFVRMDSHALSQNRRIGSSILVNRLPTSSSLGLKQLAVRADGPDDSLLFGDQAAYSGIDGFNNSLRGVGYERKLSGFQSTFYGGRAIGTTIGALGGSVSKYDITIAGLGMRRRSNADEVGLAVQSFSGASRNGGSLGASFARKFARNEFKLQSAVGRFSGLTSRDQNSQKVAVRGTGAGFSVANTFAPFKQFAVIAEADRYGKNFLTPREDPRLNGNSNEAIAVVLRPELNTSINVGASRQSKLVGDLHDTSTINYGATTGLPGWRRLHVGFFRSVTTDTNSLIGKMRLTQYMVTLPPIHELSASSYFSEMLLGNQKVQNLTNTVNVEMNRKGRLSFQDQIQFMTSHRFGMEWQKDIPVYNGFLRVGVDRIRDSNNKGSYFPMGGLRLALPHGHTMQLTYLRGQKSHTFQIEFGGSLMDRREVTRNRDAAATLIAPAPVLGRVFHDVDNDGKFNPKVDEAIAHVPVTLDNVTAETDAAGMFRFDQVSPGAHLLKAELTGVPAELVFAGQSELMLPVLPYRENVHSFRVVRTGRITGRVTFVDDRNDDEDPVEKSVPDVRIVASTDLDTFSENNGYFVLGDLPPGTYRLTPDASSIPPGLVSQPAYIEAHVNPGETIEATFHLVVPPKPVLQRVLPTQQLTDPTMQQRP